MNQPIQACGLPILVVDDDEDILNMTSFVLTRLGYAVETAKDGDIGISLLKNTKSTPCLILLDLMMPKMDGSTFRKKQLEMPNAANIPVIILSGDNALSTKAANMKVAGFEQKPISLERLATLAAKYCRPHH